MPGSAEGVQMELNEHDAHFVEEYAVLHEADVPRMAGRILAALMIADEPYLSAAQLAARLDASSGSVSSMTRYLIDNKYVERTAVPGERAKVYRMPQDAPVRLWRASFEGFARQVDLLTRRLDSGADGPEAAARLSEMRRFYAYLRDELPAFIEAYDDYPGPA